MYDSSYITLNDVDVPLKHLDKIYSAEDNVKKQEIIEYYVAFAPLILPHIINKPFSMLHFPEGVGGKSFYQKRCPVGAPKWLDTVPLKSSDGQIDWCLVNDEASIIYMANRSVIEMHTWFSRLPDLTRPDIAVIDLDPSGGAGFNEARLVASVFGVLLDKLGLFAVPKISGGNGIHIYIPVKPVLFEEVQAFLNKLCAVVAATYPDLTTVERTVNKRGNKVYLDAVQNAYGKTICAPYSLRARQNLPVAVPVRWEELNDKTLSPARFNIKNIRDRIEKTGDLFAGFYDKGQDLPKL